MYTKEQEERVLAEFQRTGSATQAVRQLGYPTLSTLYLDYYHKTGHPRYQGDIIKKARSVKNVNKVQRRI